MVAKKTTVPAISENLESFFLVLARAASTGNGLAGLVGHELGTQEQCPGGDQDQHGPAGDGEVHGGEGVFGHIIGLHEAVVLGSVGDGAGQGQDAGGADGDHDQGEHDLGDAFADLDAELSQQGGDDGKDDHGAGDQLGQQHSDQDIAEVGFAERSRGMGWGSPAMPTRS